VRCSLRRQVCLDEETLRKPETLTHTFGRSAAAIICQLIPKATSEEFPQGWHKTVSERRP
jgi:hypothetical protein